MRCGGQILWNANAICEMSKTSWQTGELHMKEDLENHSKDHLFDLVHWSNTFQSPQEIKQGFINFERKYHKTTLSSGGKFGKEIFQLQTLKNWKNWTYQKKRRRLNAKEVLITEEMENVYFLWQMVQQNYQEETTNSKNPLQGGSKPYRVRASVENFIQGAPKASTDRDDVRLPSSH